MSAILGVVSISNDKTIQADQCNLMMDTLNQYPCDDRQTWEEDHVFFGCHHQWITPESVKEKLPFHDHERKLVITADAIIDNREELLEILQVTKARRNIPDSQLILLAYQKWGRDCPKHLVGDFAFLIWDARERKLFGARDFSGARTLYYHYSDNVFSVCTTIEPIKERFNCRTLDEGWIAEYLAITGTIDTLDAHLTPYKDIKQIPPSHSITVNQDGLELERYVYLYPVEKLKLKSSEEYVEAFQEVFKKAVDSRLRSIKKVGSQLSGGLDSGAVVAFAADTLFKENKSLDTYSYIPHKDFEDFTPKQLVPDERPYIKSTVNHIPGINDHYLDFQGEDSYSIIDDLIDTMEMPYKFFENSFWLKGIYEYASRNGAGVLLNGDRGNFSISWGPALDFYSILFKKMKWLQLYQELNSYSHRVGGARIRLLPEIVNIGFPKLKLLTKQTSSSSTNKFINENFAERMKVYDYFSGRGIDRSGWLNSSNSYEARESIFSNMYPWNTGSTLTTKLSLKHSLWKRDPSNDLRVVRFCLSVPDDQFIQKGMDRALIRQATKGFLPDQVRLNQKSRGAQGVDWLHRVKPHWNSIENEINELTKDKAMQEYVSVETIEKALEITKNEKNITAISSNYKVLMRSLIFYRFMKRNY
ncbi:asparagine synthase-related protein [Halobacillus sp. K22]|uniref:asparagine synthase-related protein n=1 Tax=Halobacillus sp. K22 TaxID=3457431 RepID=UPI003FCC5D13